MLVEDPGGFMKASRTLLSLKWLKSKRTYALAAITMLVLVFQNCGGHIIQGSTASVAALSGSSTANPTGDPTPTPRVPGSAVGILPLNELQETCKATTTAPTINSVSATEITLRSGLGEVVSGDASSTSVRVSVDRGIKDLVTFEKYSCNSQFSLNLNCSVVAADPNYPISITNAFDLSGNNLLQSTPVKSSFDLARGSFIGANCNAAFAGGRDFIDFIIAPNTRNSQRCVQGSFWLKLTAANQITGIAGMNAAVQSKYLKVNVNNGCWVESRLKDSAGNLPAVINFGTAVALGSEWAAVLAPTDDSVTAVDVGSVFMYKREGSVWVQKEKLMLAEAVARESLNSISILGDTMIIGSPYRNKMGATFFYRRSGDTWNLIQRVDPPDTSQQFQDFGFAVVLNDKFAFVSSPSYMANGLAKSGSVAVYSYSSAGMTFVKNLDGIAAFSAFGFSLAADNVTLAVGAPQALGKESLGEGSVYMFTDSGSAWNLVSTATKKGTLVAEKFGAMVAIFGNRLLVGSPNHATTGKVSAGRASFFNDYTTATAPKTWDGSDAGGNTGQGLALSASGIYVASPLATARAGYVDHYLYSNLAAPYYRIKAYNGTANSAFGWSVSASGNDVLIGARIKNDVNDNSGAAYIYQYK